MMRRKDLGLRAIFGVQVIVFVLSLIGLLAALLGDAARDSLGAALLGAACLVLAGALICRSDNGKSGLAGAPLDDRQGQGREGACIHPG